MEVTVKDIQKVSLQILKEVVTICERHNLRYYLYAGSMLGAIRHPGFIPWDDDLDIAMPREDYERFKEYAKTELPARYFVQDYTTDEEYPATTPKVRDSQTTMIENGYRGLKKMNHGCFLDIFIADYYTPSFINKCRMLKVKIYKWALLMQKTYGVKPWKRFIARFFSRNRTFRAIDKTLIKMGKKKDLYLVESFFFEASTFEQRINVPFENINVAVPKDYDTALRRIYGDYMTLPPEEKRIPRHITEHVSVDVPYAEYIKNL